jgi:hypothetical protein
MYTCIYIAVPVYLQSVQVHSAKCLKTYTMASRRVLSSALLDPYIKENLLMWCIKVVYVGFEVFMVVTMKSIISWDVALCRSCENWRSGGMCCLRLQAGNNL